MPGPYLYRDLDLLPFVWGTQQAPFHWGRIQLAYRPFQVSLISPSPLTRY
jgi:hypothetical protein